MTEIQRLLILADREECAGFIAIARKLRAQARSLMLAGQRR